MKRVTMFMVTIALLVSMVAGVAVAAEVIICGTSSDRDDRAVVCEGTKNEDRIEERQGENPDTIYAKGGGDIVDATEFEGNEDQDRVYGGGGNDRILVEDGDGQDFVTCGKGKDDVVRADPGDNVSKKTCERVTQ